VTDTSFAAQRPSPDWNGWIRQLHRWLSIAFTVVVAADFAALGLGQTAMWLTLLPLLPLALLLVTGLYMFVLPHVTRRHRRRAEGRK
jgi:hypothetical protein